MKPHVTAHFCSFFDENLKSQENLFRLEGNILMEEKEIKGWNEVNKSFFDKID